MLDDTQQQLARYRTMSAVMDISSIQFYEEKKEVITNILDTAVKKLDFSQEDYISTKAELMHIIETKGNERVGLGKVVMLANQMIARVADHSGFVIVDKAEAIVEQDEIAAEAAVEPMAEAEDKVSDAGDESVHKPGLRQGQVALQQKRRESKPRDPTAVGKEKLLTLMTFLPPLISRKEIELLSARVRMATLGAPTGSVPARTTGDLELEMVNQVRDEYSHQLNDLIKSYPKAFKETIHMASGRERVEDISDKLRKQLTRVSTIAGFLSIKDLVDRQIKEFEASKQGKKSQNSSLFFWRKK